MRKVKFTSNTIRENQDIINENFDDIEKVAQEIVENVENVDKKIPTKTSQLTNDGDGVSNFDTVSSVDSKVFNLKQYVYDELSERVTLNTEQKIPAKKTFEKISFDHDINIELVQSLTDGNTNIIIGDADGQNGENSIVIGASNYSNLTGEYNVIIGNNSKSTGNSVVIGKSCTSDGDNNVNIGIINRNEGVSSVSIGAQLKTQGSNAVNIGYHSRVYNNDGISIGNFSVSASENAIAIGKNALSGAKDAIQLGSGTNSNTKSLQVFEYQLLDENGKIPEDRLPDNTATTEYVDKEISDLVNSAPETLNTLGELANAIKENESIIDTINGAIAYKADKSEIPTKTSQLQNNGDGTSKFATESYVAENGGKIDSISVNDVEQPIVNKNVNIKMPTKTSELENDGNGNSNFATESYVNELFDDVIIDYDVESIQNEDGTQTLSINGVHDYTAGAFRLIYVNSLPTENIDKHAIYLLLAEKQKDGNKYTEHVYINGTWETIGETDCLKEFDGSEEVGDLQHTLYGQDLGVQKNIPYTSTPTSSAIAQYTNNATLKVAEPVDENDVTTKKYVDDIAHSLSGQNEYIGRYAGTTYTTDTIQQELANFVQTTTGREQKKGDLVNINSAGSGVDYSGQQWIYNGTTWQYYIDFENHNVIDNLNSDNAVDSLSARQGKVLNEKFNNYALTSYVDNEVTMVKNDLNSLTERVDDHDARLTTIDSGISTLEQGLNTTNGRIDELDIGLNTLGGRVDSHDERLTDIDSGINALEQGLNTANGQIGELGENITSLDDKLNKTENDLSLDIQGVSDNLNETASALQNNLNAIDNKVGDLTKYWQYGELTTDVVEAINQNAVWIMLNFEQLANKTNDILTNKENTTLYPSVNAVYDLFAPHIIYNDPTGFEASNNDAGETWHLTGLDLTPYKRIKCYVTAGGDGDTNYSPQHIVEISLDDRAKGSFGYFTTNHAGHCPNNTNRHHMATFTVNAEKTAIQFQHSISIYGTAVSDSVGGRRCFLIEGYKI